MDHAEKARDRVECYEIVLQSNHVIEEVHRSHPKRSFLVSVNARHRMRIGSGVGVDNNDVMKSFIQIK
jgi:hypothetical protein